MNNARYDAVFMCVWDIWLIKSRSVLYYSGIEHTHAASLPDEHKTTAELQGAMIGNRLLWGIIC